MAMIPHEKTLVKRLEAEPFILLGVNTDAEDVYRKKRAEMGVTWPSFFDGGKTGGPIARAWNVSGYPTIYVMDHEGRIRFKGVRGERMDHAVDTLLAEMKGEPAPRAPWETDAPEGGPDGAKGKAIPATRLGPMTPAKKKGESIPAVRLGPMTPARKKGAGAGEGKDG